MTLCAITCTHSCHELFEDVHALHSLSELFAEIEPAAPQTLANFRDDALVQGMEGELRLEDPSLCTRGALTCRRSGSCPSGVMLSVRLRALQANVRVLCHGRRSGFGPRGLAPWDGTAAFLLTGSIGLCTTETGWPRRPHVSASLATRAWCRWACVRRSAHRRASAPAARCWLVRGAGGRGT